MHSKDLRTGGEGISILFNKMILAHQEQMLWQDVRVNNYIVLTVSEQFLDASL